MNWIFIAALLHLDEGDPNSIHLSPTERQFMQRSAFDQVIQGTAIMRGKSLHYLNPETELLTAFRSLRLIHEPQLYRGRKESHKLSEVVIARKTGEFAHPGERERWQEYQQAKRCFEKERNKERHNTQLFVPAGVPPRSRREPLLSRDRRESLLESEQECRAPNVVPVPGNKEAICMFCGNRTSDWLYFDGQAQRCRCRDCQRKGLV
ncbi:MAG: hypothetical protein M3347_15325 [Armatimonadota bacterium]|nr:hypothetical protein [Armatimonadota bacterium]